MIDGTVPFIAFCLSLREHLGGGSLDSVKRKLRLLIRLVRCGKVSDPLSSMSNPPSPPRIPHHEPVSSIRDAQVSASAAPRSSPSPMSTLALAATAPASPFYDPIRRHYEIDRPLPGHALHMPSAHQQEQASHNIPGPSTFQPGPYSLQPTSQPFVQSASSTSSVHHSTSSRGGRKSKAHVASACINCKRAHLSCDVGRPCTRCVASGKQDSCVDVQHKKRGRPRLREEGEFKAEQLAAQARSFSTIAAGNIIAPSRPIAAPRHRRTESFRSIRSQGSEGSAFEPSPPHHFPRQQTTLQPAFGYQPTSTTARYEVPTAYLNMDLLVIKANGPFRQIMNGGRDPTGRQISDLAGFADGESFFNIRNRLRAEREAREPVYMPPIMQQGHDPLGGASESDVDRYTHGFDDGTYTWHRLQGGPSEAPFPARIRLGKANAYFVAVTLPSFRPVEMPAQPLINPPALRRSPPDSHSMRTSPPDRPQRAGFVPYTETPMLPAQPTPQTNRPAVQQMAPRSYPPPHLPMPPLHRQVSQASVYPAYQTTPLGTPRLSIAEPPTETTAFTPRASSRETQAVPVPPPSLQLPPIVGNRTPLQSPYPTAGPSTALPSGQAPQRRSESDEDGRQESPKKRRRMDIDDVLHR